MEEKHLKKFSCSLAIREIEIKMTRRFYHMPDIMSTTAITTVLSKSFQVLVR